MRLDADEAWTRVTAARHATLGTIHRDRGPDLVPVVFAVGDTEKDIFIPIDTVKAKTTTRLQRLENLKQDARCTLLVEHYATDWTQLWWVRITATGSPASPAEVEAFLPLLAQRYEPYREAGAIAGGIMLAPRQVVGWAAVG